MSVRMCAGAAALLFTVAFGRTVLASDKPPVRVKVYCFTASSPSGFVGPDDKERSDSVADLRKALAKKKDWLEVVDSPDDADITVEVMARAYRETGEVNTTTTSEVSKPDKHGNSHVTTSQRSSKEYEYWLSTTLHAGDYSTAIETAAGPLGGWRIAAGGIAGQVEKWVKTNYGRLMDGRRAGARSATPLPARRETESARAAARGPRDTARAWLTATTQETALEYLPARVQADIARVLSPLSPEQQRVVVATFNVAAAPGAATEAMGGSVLARGDTVTMKGGLDFTLALQREQVTRDSAIVPLRTTGRGVTNAQGRIELRRGDAGWTVVAVDYGIPDGTMPRFDSPTFVKDTADMVLDGIKKARRAGDEAAALGALRSLVSAEAAAAAVNGDFFVPMECLLAPAHCGLEAGGSGPPLSNPIEPARFGYNGVFHAGPAPKPAARRRAKASPRSLQRWSYVLTPSEPGPEWKAFCADSSGTICEMPRGTPAAASVCPTACTAVR